MTTKDIWNHHLAGIAVNIPTNIFAKLHHLSLGFFGSSPQNSSSKQVLAPVTGRSWNIRPGPKLHGQFWRKSTQNSPDSPCPSPSKSGCTPNCLSWVNSPFAGFFDTPWKMGVFFNDPRKNLLAPTVSAPGFGFVIPTHFQNHFRSTVPPWLWHWVWKIATWWMDPFSIQNVGGVSKIVGHPIWPYWVGLL